MEEVSCNQNICQIENRIIQTTPSTFILSLSAKKQENARS